MFSKRLKNLNPYVPGEQPQNRKYIKLNTNENPYPPSPEIINCLKKLNIEDLRLYPDPQSDNLRQKIADRHNIDKSMVFAGNGSDEILSFSFYAFFDSAFGNLLFPQFTYSFYSVYCSFYEIEYLQIPLNYDFSVDLSGFLEEEHSCGVIFPNPNAPTGILLSIEELTDFFDKYHSDKVVIIDEAYIDFGGISAIELIESYKNLLITRTFSKSMALAGLRLGYAIGNKKLIDALFAVKDSFNSYPSDILAQKIGAIAISDERYYKEITEKIISSRKYLVDELVELGWTVVPSKANFIFVAKKGVAGKDIYLKLKDNGILVRHFDIDGIKDYVRITIGKKDELDILLNKISKYF